MRYFGVLREKLYLGGFNRRSIQPLSGGLARGTGAPMPCRILFFINAAAVNGGLAVEAGTRIKGIAQAVA